MAYIPTIKIVRSGNVPACDGFIKFAVNQLSILERQMELSNLSMPGSINDGVRRVSPFPGVFVECVSSFSNHEVRIHVAGRDQVAQGEESRAGTLPKYLTEKKTYNIVALARSWSWDSSAILPYIRSGTPYTRPPENICLTVGFESFIAGEISEDKEVSFSGASNFSYEHSNIPMYKITDLNQVRYASGDKHTSLIISEFEEILGDADTKEYYAIDVVGEGMPSLSKTISKIGVYDPVHGVVSVDAALSVDLQTLYFIQIERISSYGNYRAYVWCRKYTVSPTTGEWVEGADKDISHFDDMFVYGYTKVDRQGNVGIYSYVNPAPTRTGTGAVWTGFAWESVYETKSRCTKYVFSIEDESFVETENVYYGSKIPDLSTLDYEIVKYSPISSLEYGSGVNPLRWSYYAPSEVSSNTVYTSTASFTYPFFGEHTSDERTYDTRLQVLDSVSPTSGHFTKDGGVTSVYQGSVSPVRRAILFSIQSSGSYSSVTPYNGTITVMQYDAVGDITSRYFSGLDLNPPFGIDPIDYNVYERYHNGPWTITAGAYTYVYDSLMYSEKRYVAVNALYPPINCVKEVAEIPNAFISCDQESGLALYGAFVKSTDQPYNGIGRQVWLYPTVDSVDPNVIDSAAAWKIYLYDRSINTSTDISSIVHDIYTRQLPDTSPVVNVPTLLENQTPVEVPPIDYATLYPDYAAPWEKVPPTYSFLESFFGLVFYGDKVTTIEEVL